MNTRNLAAAMNIAYAVAAVDNATDDEKAVLLKEMKSFNLTEDQVKNLLDTYNEMSAFKAIEYIRESDDATKKEAQALTIIAMIADGELSDKEIGAFKLVCKLCGFGAMTLEEAHAQLGF